MGILVVGAERFEEGVDHLRRNLVTMTEETRSKAEPRIRSTWKQMHSALEGAEIKLRPVVRRIKPEKLERDTKIFVVRAQTRTRLLLSEMIGNTITGLEKIKRNIDVDYRKRIRGAA